jgi:MFS transporter, DHA3 family, macrolide efflux protein
MAVFSRNFVLLWQGQLVSQLGNQAFLVATTYFVLEATGSSTLVGLIMMAATVPLALISPIGGVLADRHSRRSIIILTDVLRAGVIGSLGLLVLWRPGPAAIDVALFVLVAAFGGTMAALFTPAIQAFIPEVVHREHLAAANSASQFSTQATILVGQAIGGVLYLRWGAGVLLVLDALSFGYAALATSMIPAPTAPAAPSVGLSFGVKQYAAEAREGLAYLRQQPGMIGVLAMFAGVNLLFMPVFVLLPLYVRDVLGSAAEWYGFLLAASGAGALCGAAAAGSLLRRCRDTDKLLRRAVRGIALAVGLLAVASTHVAAVVAFAAIGCLSSLVNVTVVTLFQSAAHAGVRGRVMALVVAVSTAAVPVGLALGGVMGDLWRAELQVVFAGCGAAMAAITVVGRSTAGLNDVLDTSATADPRHVAAGTPPSSP